MRFPTLEQQNTDRQMIDVFGGYNHNLRISENEFFDMKNLTSTHYPVLSPRPQRGVYETGTTGEKIGLIAKDSLGYIEGGEFHLNQYSTVGLNIDADAVADKTSIVSMGAYVVIIARDIDGNIVSKKWVNTNDLNDFGDIDASVEYEPGAEITITMCDAEGNDLDNLVESQNEKTNGAMYIDKTGDKITLMQYSESSAMWSTVSTTYIRLEAPGIGIPFNQYDGVRFSGFNFPPLDDINEKVCIIQAKTDDSIVIVGIIDVPYFAVNGGVFSFKREMPLMDFVIESENRLWGCRYGMALNGEIVNEIYASKLGDFKNWNCFMGVSTDSYAATVGTDGQFTGAVTHLGYPLFFKENCMHKVYGNYPANYQIQTTACRGVQKGCQNSLAIVNETLYYKSRSAVCAYDGSLPSEVSSDLGDVSYSNAVACSHGNKYYISMMDGNEEYTLFVYDAAKGMWHKEDDLRVDAFCSCRGELYYIDYYDKQIKTILGSGTKDTTPVQWMAETGNIGTDSPDKKHISRLNIRMALDIGTRVHVYIQYDSIGSFEQIVSLSGSSLRSFSIPIRPKRCDHMKLRIVGTGDAKIYSITKTIEEGSDI